jgi:hypothetical protein
MFRLFWKKINNREWKKLQAMSCELRRHGLGIKKVGKFYCVYNRKSKHACMFKQAEKLRSYILNRNLDELAYHLQEGGMSRVL